MRIFFLLLLLSFAANAGPHRGALPSAGRSYHWYEGDVRRTVWVDAALAGEFSNTETVRVADPKAQRVQGYFGHAKIWKLSRMVESGRLLQLARSANPTAKVSPIFHESRSRKSGLRALPGNALVVLRPDWDARKVAEWASHRGVVILRKLPAVKNGFVVKTDPGLASLFKANELMKVATWSLRNLIGGAKWKPSSFYLITAYASSSETKRNRGLSALVQKTSACFGRDKLECQL